MSYWNIFCFSQETGFDISWKLSSLETICMKCWILFSGKSKENINLLSAEFAHSILSVNGSSHGRRRQLACDGWIFFLNVFLETWAGNFFQIISETFQMKCHFYYTPIERYGDRPGICLSVCPSIHPSVCRRILVRPITPIPFELFSWNFVRL